MTLCRMFWPFSQPCVHGRSAVTVLSEAWISWDPTQLLDKGRVSFSFFSLSHFGALVHWMAIRTPDTNKRHRGHTTLTQVRGNFDWNTKK